MMSKGPFLYLVRSGREPCAANPEGESTAADDPSLSGGAAPQGASRPVTLADLIDVELRKIDAILERMEAIVEKL